MSGTNFFPKYVKTTLGGAAAFAIGLSTSFACKSTVLDPNHCFNTLGDDKCAELYPDGSRPFCGAGTCFPEVDDGCVEARPETDDCYSPCGRQMSAEDDLSCAGGEDGSDTGTMSGGMTMGDDDDDDDDDDSTTTMGDDDDDSSSDETGPVACVDDGDCAGMGNQVFCEGDVCVDCNAAGGDAACAEANAETPVCEAGGGCVQCTAGDDSACEGTTPICDTEAFTCRECLQHSECDSGACKIPVNIANDPNWGACFENVVEVSVGDVQAELAGPIVDELAVIIIDDEMGAAATVNINIDGNTDIAIIAQDGLSPLLERIGSNSQITLSSNAAAWIYNVQVANNPTGGVPAIDANSAQLHIQRSRIVANDGGGIVLANGARAVIENSFVSGNGSEFSPTTGLRVDGSSVRVLYSTLANNEGTPVASSTIDCTGNGDGEVRNSLLLGNDAPDTIGTTGCGVLTFDTSVVDTAGLAGAGNTLVEMFEPTWFPQIAMSDYHLTTGTAAEDAAVWVSGDPEIDIDGDLRPTMNDTMDVAGADIP